MWEKEKTKSKKLHLAKGMKKKTSFKVLSCSNSNNFSFKITFVNHWFQIFTDRKKKKNK